jgi:hypothetical protein
MWPVGWKPLVKGALRGFATVELLIGLRLIDCAVLVSKNKAWANVPSNPVLDRDGQQKIEANGKPGYVPVLELRSRDLAQRFSAAVVKVVRRRTQTLSTRRGHDRRCGSRLFPTWVARFPLPLARRAPQAPANRARVTRSYP